MKYYIVTIIILISSFAKAQNPLGIMCLPMNSQPLNIQNGRSVNDMKTVRINFNFMLKTDGTGNFNETTDGDGRLYSGYDFAFDITQWMKDRNDWNEKMNIPTGNTTTNPPKNIYYILDGVYFQRNSSIYNYGSVSSSNYSTLGTDRDSVLNIFLTRSPNENTDPSYSDDSTTGGSAWTISPTSKDKFTENMGYWQGYVFNRRHGFPFDWCLHGSGANFNHELYHLMGLSHTVMRPGATQCPTGCPGYGAIDYNCGDGCNDTPTAWDIMTANGCTKHPACGWGTGSQLDCSNNVMDYSGANALTPCQIGIAHGSLEGGMRSYLACAANSVDKTYCDVGYPKVSYFGKNIIIGNCGSLADVTNREKITTYFSSSVELNNFEVRSDSEFEVIYQALCNF